MFKKIIFVVLALLSWGSVFSQVTPRGSYTISDSLTAFGQNISIGYTLFNANKQKYYICIMGATATETLASSAAKFKEIGMGAGGEMTYPGTGVPYSEGISWGPSIDSATIAFIDQYNSFTRGQKLPYLDFDTTAAVPIHNNYRMFPDTVNKTLGIKLGNDVTMQLGQEEWIYAYNNSGSAMTNGQAVYLSGAYNGYPTIRLAQADSFETATTIGVLTQDIPNGKRGMVTSRGIVHDINTSALISGQFMYLSGAIAGAITATRPEAPYYDVRLGKCLTTGNPGDIYVRQYPAYRLTDLSDVTTTSPTVDQVLKYNGIEWINGPPGAISSGPGVDFYLDSTKIIRAGTGPQSIVLESLNRYPITTPEQDESVTVNNSTLLIDRYMYNTALGGTTIDAGTWTFDTYTYVDNTGGVSTIPKVVYKVVAGVGTVTIIGSGTTRTATVTGGGPFVSGDANADKTLAGVLQTPNGIFQITAYTSTSTVSILTLSTYTNETGVAYSVHNKLFLSAGAEINNLAVGLMTTQSTQPAFAINSTDKLSVAYFAKTTRNGNVAVHLVYNGNANYSHFTIPMTLRHNDLAGLQGGDATNRWHLTLPQHTWATSIPGTGVPISTGSAWGTSIPGVADYSLRYISGAWRAWPDSVGSGASYSAGYRMQLAGTTFNNINYHNTIDSVSASIPYTSTLDKFLVIDTVTGKLHRRAMTPGSGVPTTEIKNQLWIGVDTTDVSTSRIYWMGYSDGFVVDSLIFSLHRRSGSPDVTCKVWYGTSQNSAGTAIVSAGNQITSYAGITRTGTINNATIPRGNEVWATFSAVSVIPKGFFVTIMGHRQ
jgi:hypothetical protein